MKLGEAFVEIRADDAKLRAALANAETASKKTTGTIVSGMVSIGNSVLGLSAKYAVLEYAISRAFDQIASPIKEAYTAVEDFQGNIVRTAALIASFQKEGDLATNFKEAKDYAASLAYTMYDIDAKSIAGAKDLQLMTAEMVKQGIVLDNNNQRQIDAFTNIANAVAVIAEGYGAKEIQVRQEIRALLLGEVRTTNQLAQQIDAMIGGGLKKAVEQWKQQGTLIENVGELLKGYGAAVSDFERMWAAIGSTMESIKNRILIEGFTPIYRDINSNLIRMNNYIKEHSNILSGSLLFAARSVQGVFESVRNLLLPFADPLKLAAGFVIQIVAGLGMVAYTILPPLTERIGHFLKSMVDIVFAAGNFAKVLWDVASLDFEAAVEDLKAAKARWGEAGRSAGEAFGGGFDEEVVRRYNEMVTTLNAPGKVKTPKLDGAGEKETAEEQIQVLKTKLGERISTVKSYADLENELEKVNLASKEILWRQGLETEDSYLQAKNRLEEEAALATLDSLKQQLEETQSTYDEMVALAESKGKRERMIVEQSKATASIRDEITKTNINLLLIEKNQELDAIDRQKRMAETQRQGVLRNLEQQVQLVNQLNSLQAEFGVISPTQQVESEIEGRKEILNLQNRSNIERIMAGGLTQSEVKSLWDQVAINNELLEGDKARAIEILKRLGAKQSEEEIDRQRLQSQYRYRQDVAELLGNFRESYSLQVKSLQVERQRALEKAKNTFGYTLGDKDSINEYYDLLEKRLQNLQSPVKAFLMGTEDMVKVWGNASIQMEELGKESAQTIQRNFSNLLFDAVKGDLRSFSDYWDSIWESMLKTVMDKVSKMAVSAAWNLGKGLLNSAASWAGSLLKFHEGAWDVKNPTGSDEFWAMLEEGEMVVPKEIAKQLRNIWSMGSPISTPAITAAQYGAWMGAMEPGLTPGSYGMTSYYGALNSAAAYSATVAAAESAPAFGALSAYEAGAATTAGAAGTAGMATLSYWAGPAAVVAMPLITGISLHHAEKKQKEAWREWWNSLPVEYRQYLNDESYKTIAWEDAWRSIGGPPDYLRSTGLFDDPTLWQFPQQPSWLQPHMEYRGDGDIYSPSNWMPSTRWDSAFTLGSFGAGTGPEGLPDDGTYYGHRGEIVLNPEQSDALRNWMPSTRWDSAFTLGTFRTGTGLEGLPGDGMFYGHDREIVLNPEQSDAFRAIAGEEKGETTIHLHLYIDGKEVRNTITKGIRTDSELQNSIRRIMVK